MPGARRVLVDTGPLVAWINRQDQHHARVKQYLDTYDGELLSNWLVVTETCHLLPESLRLQFMQWVAEGGITLVELPPSAANALAERMGKYADLPMDIADASLVWLAESMGLLDVLTLDRRDFGIYRTERGRTLRNPLFDSPGSTSLPRPRPKSR